MRRMKDMKNVYKILVAIPLGNGSLESLMRIWDSNIKIDFKQLGCEGMKGSR
jgi:hypothetical protein